MSGNKISVKTLDLNQDFSKISAQLNAIVDEYFRPQNVASRKRNSNEILAPPALPLAAGRVQRKSLQLIMTKGHDTGVQPSTRQEIALGFNPLVQLISAYLFFSRN